MSSARTRKKKTRGQIWFLGAGPGDPELLTLRGVAALSDAEVLVVDADVATDSLRGRCRDDVEVHRVDGDDHAGNGKLVVREARAGRQVVRLVGGDPVLFGPFANEAAACAKAGLPYEVLPGVSAAIAVPAYAGVPLTTAKQREVRVVSAADETEVSALGDSTATVVVLDVEAAVAETAAALVEGGRDESTPVSVTWEGTTTRQRTVVSTLGGVAADTKDSDTEAPAVLVVGDVVAQRERLSWFETKPLFGWRVLIPRTREQAAPLTERLRRYGAVPEEVPTISVEPPRTPQQMERAVKGLVNGSYEWLVFTSANAVRAVREKFTEYGLDARAFAGVKIAAIGEQTAESIEAFGIRPDLVPTGQQSSEGLLEEFPPYDSVFDPINKVLLPRADIATETLVAGLERLGWEAEDVTAYRTVRAAPPPAETREAIKSGGFDAVLFTSSSTVRNLVGIAGKPHATTIVGVIGPATAETAEEFGLRVDVTASSPSALQLADEVAEFAATRRDEMLEAGQAFRRPSEMRRGARRRAK
ncbi:MAG: bifunctional uroporphyrinogen-III C-methyltransferase/uroporphyrinogen-III synthase [Streptosporangiales bacterium]|nr:bifunctional uroporphyrinogen-III C-methyltransferase/uroporphyrinogen-III synthase [Streptosporangiales bacterium]